MSWALSTAVHPAAELNEALDHTTTRAHISQDQLKQVRVAKEAAMQLVESGTVGDPGTDSYRVSLSGHHGEGGIGLDGITVSIILVPAATA